MNSQVILNRLNIVSDKQMVSDSQMVNEKQSAVVLLGYKDMQTNFLSSLIKNELGMDCTIQTYAFGSTNTVSDSGQLVLLDCKYVPVEEIGVIFESMDNTESRIALINIKFDKRYEKLAQWPQVKGMFYETVEQTVLLSGLRELLNGGNWLPRGVMQTLIDEYRCAPRKPKNTVKLTRRECQILKMLLDGSTNLEIAEGLQVSEYTIKSHLYNVFKKIDVKNRIQAYNWAQLHLSES